MKFTLSSVRRHRSKTVTHQKKNLRMRYDTEQEQQLSDVLKTHPDVVEVATEPGVLHWLLAVLH